jgi:hypothetical protein
MSEIMFSSPECARFVLFRFRSFFVSARWGATHEGRKLLYRLVHPDVFIHDRGFRFRELGVNTTHASRQYKVAAGDEELLSLGT